MNAGVIYNIGIETNVGDIFKSINESIKGDENNSKEVKAHLLEKDFRVWHFWVDFKLEV